MTVVCLVCWDDKEREGGWHIEVQGQDDKKLFDHVDWGKGELWRDRASETERTHKHTYNFSNSEMPKVTDGFKLLVWLQEYDGAAVDTGAYWWVEAIGTDGVSYRSDKTDCIEYRHSRHTNDEIPFTLKK
jgi:hypothetical protein